MHLRLLPRVAGICASLRCADLRDDAVEDAALVRQLLAHFADALFASAQRPEVFHRLWHRLAKQAHDDPACVAQRSRA